MTSTTCPAEHDLVPLATGDTAAPAVLEHVAHCEPCRACLDRMRAELAALRDVMREDAPGAEPTAGGQAPSPSWSTVTFLPTDDAAGSARPAAIGKYLVVGYLDGGGQAEIDRVVHPGLGRNLVLKLGRVPLGAGGMDRDRLVAEGRLLAGLDHPHLVKVHDLDLHEGRPFLVMDYVRGRNLQQYAEQERPDPRRAAAIVAKLERAVGAVHRLAVLHQDIKPKNVLIDETGRPRLIDFGLARLQDAWTAGEAGPSGGTVAYIAPEQARAEGDRLGPRADVFALGGVLYFLLVGRAPFQGQTLADAWDRARRCDFDRSALRAAGVSRPLERIVLRAMAAEPDDRYPTADALTEALERSTRPPLRRALRGGAAVLGLAAIAGLVWWSTRPPSPPPVQAPAPAPLSVAMQVDLFRRSPKGEGGGVESRPVGTLGITTFAGRFPSDDVRVTARLSAPAYYYLIALNPDGRDQLCVPADAATPPRVAASVTFPPGPDEGFGLTDGAGLQAFLLVASRRPLPPYRVWRSRLGGLPWRPTVADRGWRYDGLQFEPLTEEDEAIRGSIRKLSSLPGPFQAVCAGLRDRPDVDAIRAVCFPVHPGS